MYLGTQAISAAARRFKTACRVLASMSRVQLPRCIEAGGRLGPDNIRPNQICADRALGCGSKENSVSARPQFSGELFGALASTALKLRVTFSSFIAMILLIVANVNISFQYSIAVFPIVHFRSRKLTHPTFQGQSRWWGGNSFQQGNSRALKSL